MDVQETFAANVRKYRKMAGLSQEKLAELAGLHRTYIGGIEQRRVNVSLKNIGKIANALQMDPSALFLSGGIASKLANPHAGGASVKATERPPEYALCAWHNGKLTVSPIEVDHEDLTVQILCELIASGHKGKNLAKRYNEVSQEILTFLRQGATPPPS